MTQNGTLGTSNRPTAISTELLSLLNGEAAQLVALGIDAADTQDGTLVFTDKTGNYQGEFGSQEVVYYENGTGYPVVAAEWVDASGSIRPVTEWHLGARNGQGSPPDTLQTTEDWEDVPNPNTPPDTLRTTEDWEDVPNPNIPPDTLRTTEDWEGKSLT